MRVGLVRRGAAKPSECLLSPPYPRSLRAEVNSALAIETNPGASAPLFRRP